MLLPYVIVRAVVWVPYTEKIILWTNEQPILLK